ncbi:MAG: polysaccharide biosynthesis/export family protein [Planctomycetes bacterium]|nr:polysaccharide biosynthesis/export family protein [Planctomycetota bacterium]
MSLRLLLPLLLLAACSHPVKEGVSLGEDPDLLGPNITEEIRAGEFRIGGGDLIDVDIWDHPDLTRSYTVAPDGTLFCHLVGTLDAYGLTRIELRDRLTAAYGRYLVEPSLDVTVHLSLLRKVTMLGMVKNPGVLPMSTPRTSVLDMIARAGGISAEGDTTGVVLARLVDGEVQVRSYNIDLLFDPEVMGEIHYIPYVQPGDYVYVLRTDLAVFNDSLQVVGDTLRAIQFAELDLILAPRVDDAVFSNSF